MYCYIRTTYRVHYCTPYSVLSPVYSVPYRPKGKPRQSSARCISSHIIHGDSLVHGRRVHTYSVVLYSVLYSKTVCQTIAEHVCNTGTRTGETTQPNGWDVVPPTSQDWNQQGLSAPRMEYLVCNTPYSRVLYSIRSNLYGNIREYVIRHHATFPIGPWPGLSI